MLVVLCGVPASGKTTLSEGIALSINAKVYHYDDVLGGHHPAKIQELHRQMWQGIVTDLQNGYNVVCDDLNTKLEWRQGILSAVSGIDCKKILIVMTTPLSECLKRNANRQMRLPDFIVESIAKDFEAPAIDEGWDEIVYY